MDTPAGPDPNINVGGEEAGAETRETLVGLRIEVRAIHRNIVVELEEMRKMRAAQRREFGWLIGIYLAGIASLLVVMAKGFHWL